MASDVVKLTAANEKMNIVDNASLTFFTNPLYLNIIQRKNLCSIKDNTEEIKFYRKRIVSLFKDMFKEPPNREIKEIHTMFVNAAIRYFEITDKKDIIQGQHQPDADADANAVSNTVLNPEDILNTIGGSDLLSVNEANDKMMRKTVAVASLANYVISKQDNSANEKRIIPMKMEIDLKIKGIPPKKNKNKK